jgi:hypothetical protein
VDADEAERLPPVLDLRQRVAQQVAAVVAEGAPETLTSAS